MAVSFNVSGKRYKCDVAGNACADAGSATAGGGGRRDAAGAAAEADAAAVARRRRPRRIHVARWQARRLHPRQQPMGARCRRAARKPSSPRTASKDFGYATDNAGWQSSDRPIVVWSPDSKKIATYPAGPARRRRNVSGRNQSRPPHAARMEIPAARRRRRHHDQPVIIDVAANQMVRLQDSAATAPLHALRRHQLRRRMVRRAMERRRRAPGLRLHLARSPRRRRCALPTPPPAPCATSIDEKVATFFESGNGAVNWKYLSATNEFIWFSEQDNWGHLYLYDHDHRRIEESDHQGRLERHPDRSHG